MVVPCSQLQIMHLFLKMTIIHILPTLPNWHLPLPLFPLRPPQLSSPTPRPPLLAKMPAPSCLTLGFLAFSWRWSNPSEQYWTSHSIQTSFFYLFIYLFLISSPLFSSWFSILLRLHPVHSWSVRKERLGMMVSGGFVINSLKLMSWWHFFLLISNIF